MPDERSCLHLHIIRAVTGAGGEAVVQRVAKGAYGICPSFAGEAGGGWLIHLAAVLHVLPSIGMASQSGILIEAAAAAMIQLVQGLQREVETDRLCVLQRDLLLQKEKTNIGEV